MSSLDWRTFDDLLLKCLEGSATAAEQQAAIEAMETDEACWKRAVNHVELDAGLKSLQDREKAGPFAAQLLRRITREEESRAFARRAQERLRLEASEQARRGAQPSVAIQLSRTRSVIYASASAAILLMAGGLIALWCSPGDRERPLTPQERRHQEIIVEQLRELKLERAAVTTSTPERSPETKAESSPPDDAARIAMQREGEEAARFIEARQRFMLQQLRLFQGRRPLPEGLDIDEFYSKTAPDAGAPVVAETGPVEIGRVLQTEGEEAGVLIRDAEKAPNRIALKKGQALLSGDRIETARSGTTPRTSLRLDGGATLDLDCGTSIEVLGRDALRFTAGRIYAHITVPDLGETDIESAPPFSVQTEAGQLLTHELQAEISLFPNTILHRDLQARVDGGKVHLVNRKGHVVGRKGQELLAIKDMAPTRGEGFSKTIWRGRERAFEGLPFGRSSPVIFSATPTEYVSMYYVAALALRGEIDLAGLQFMPGTPGPGPTPVQLRNDMTRLHRQGPKRVPAPVPGASEPLRMPPSRTPDDTHPLRTEAALQTLARAQEAEPSHPLIVICSGAMTDVACAWLLDHRMAERVVVVLSPKPSRGVKWAESDPWAAEIVLRHLRCITVKGTELPLARAHPERIVDPRWRPLAGPDLQDDPRFRLVYFVTRPDTGTPPRRVSFAGFVNEEPQFQPDRRGRILQIEIPGEDTLLREFERVFLP